MNHLRTIVGGAMLSVMLITTTSSAAFAGTIVGARSSRTGNIAGTRSGNIAGTRVGNIAGTSARNNTRSGATRTDASETRLSFGTLISENIGGILRIFFESSLF